jgi:hypothetical protein
MLAFLFENIDARRVNDGYLRLKVLNKVKFVVPYIGPPRVGITEIRTLSTPAWGVLISVMPCSWGVTLHKKPLGGGVSNITSPQPSTLRPFSVDNAPALGLYPTLPPPPPAPFLKTQMKESHCKVKPYAIKAWAS